MWISWGWAYNNDQHSKWTLIQLKIAISLSLKERAYIICIYVLHRQKVTSLTVVSTFKPFPKVMRCWTTLNPNQTSFYFTTIISNYSIFITLFIYHCFSPFSSRYRNECLVHLNYFAQPIFFERKLVWSFYFLKEI